MFWVLTVDVTLLVRGVHVLAMGDDLTVHVLMNCLLYQENA